eukprot:CFRG7108T1
MNMQSGSGHVKYYFERLVLCVSAILLVLLVNNMYPKFLTILMPPPLEYERYSSGCTSFDMYNKTTHTSEYVSSLPACGLLHGNETMRFSLCDDIKKSNKMLVVVGCDWQKFTHTGALALLANKHVVLVGDSRIRYQYLATAYWLENGVWPPDNIDENGRLSPTKEALWTMQGKTWKQFYQDTNGYLNGNEQCDCYRNSEVFDPVQVYENRYFHMKTYNISITYYEYFATMKGRDITGHYGFPPYDKTKKQKRKKCKLGICNRKTDWKFLLEDAMNTLFPSVGASDVFISFGWYPKNQLARRTSDRWIRAVDNAADHGINLYIINSHSSFMPERFSEETYESVQRTIVNKQTDGSQTHLDLHRFSEHFVKLKDVPMWDALHFEAWVYSEFTQFFLQAIYERNKPKEYTFKSM